VCIALILKCVVKHDPLERTLMSNPSIKKSSEASGETPADVTLNAAPEWIGTLCKWNMEFAELYRKRLQEWLMLPVSVAQCRSPDDLRDAQVTFADTLIADYRRAAQQLWNAVNPATDEPKVGASEAYAATLLKAQADAENILAQARAQAQRIIDGANAQRGASPESAQETRVA
jgi:hypothetical protein